MPTINIDGRNFVGRSANIVNSVVMIDGKRRDGTVSGVVEIRIIDGVPDTLQCGASVSCDEGPCQRPAGGSTSCDRVGGNAMAGGSVNWDAVSGSVSAGRSVRHG